MLGGLEPNVYILGQANIDMRTISEHVFSFSHQWSIVLREGNFLYTRVLLAHFGIVY